MWKSLIVLGVALGAIGLGALSLRADSPPLAPIDGLADLVYVEKAARRLTLKRGEQVLASYSVALGFEPVGHKREEGDGKTPEGRYTISGRNPNSRYHLSLRVSYPNAEDRAQAAARGVSPGGDIMIHGLPNGVGWISAEHTLRDWTLGCVAVTNAEIEQIWNAVPNGTVVEIVP
jgi:murein L,D-transpeptidase YafK